MSTTSSQGRGRNQPSPLRRQTRAEAGQARRQLRGWRTRKMAMAIAGMPIVVIAAVGVAMAAPSHNGGSAAACTTNTASSPAAAGKNGTTVNDIAPVGYTKSQSQLPSATAGAAGTATTATATAGTTTTTAAAKAKATASTPAAAATTTTAAAKCATAAATTSAAAAAAATPNPNCTLIVPANPLSAKGLATPYQLVATDAAMGPCHEANANQSAFVEGAILTATGNLMLYDPLVIDKGTTPAAPTTPATVPAGSVVGLWYGFNGTNLTLQSAAGTNSLARGNCVNGSRGSIFGQFSYCNAPAFFRSANRAIAAGQLKVPAVGTAKDGLACPTVRDFSVVDQDQSDNVVTHYLANANGQIAQLNAANMAKLGASAVDLANGSDNLLLNKFIDPALGCTSFTAPDQSSGNTPSAALPLDELSAAADQKAPIAIVPLSDPMTLNNANQSATKTNLYRVGVDQAPINAANSGSGAAYCRNLFGAPQGIARVFKDMALFQNAPSVDAAMATNLFTFLAMRAQQSFTNLGCQGLLHMNNPITLTMTNNIVTAATFTAGGAPRPATGTPPAGAATTPTPSATNPMIRRHKHW